MNSVKLIAKYPRGQHIIIINGATQQGTIFPAFYPRYSWSSPHRQRVPQRPPR